MSGRRRFGSSGGRGRKTIRDEDPVLFLEHKYLYRRVRGVLPEAVRLRPKMSFPVPVREWFGDGLGPLAREVLDSSPLVGTVFDPEAIRRTLDTASLPDSGTILWPVVNLCLWHRWMTDQAGAGKAQAASSLEEAVS
jgi:asparagine synthetase B (glutamine-hydrolysing)